MRIDILSLFPQITDAAVAVTRARWGASVGGFWTVVEDAIANVTIQSTPTIIRQRRNAGTTTLRPASQPSPLGPASTRAQRPCGRGQERHDRH